MAKYRKTSLVEAEQFLPPNHIPEGCYQEGTIGDVAAGHGQWFLETLEGKHPLRYADYICKGVQGERWNVEVSIFQSTYELVTATPAASGEIPGGMVDAAMLGEVMQDAWSEICDDAGAHPSDMKHGRGTVLFYAPGHWTDLIALRLSERLSTPKASAETGERPKSHRTTEPFPISAIRGEATRMVAEAKADLIAAERRLELICRRGAAHLLETSHDR